MIEKINVPIKRAGDTFSATELNQIVAGINTNSENLQTEINEILAESDTGGIFYIVPNAQGVVNV